MNTPASPWDILLRGPRMRIQSDPAAQDADVSAGTKLARLLDDLAKRESATTLTLCACAELSSRQVWGLLKGPLQIGQVRYAEGRWSLVQDFAGRRVQRAAALLRSRGWRVEPPDGREAA